MKKLRYCFRIKNSWIIFEAMQVSCVNYTEVSKQYLFYTDFYLASGRHGRARGHSSGRYHISEEYCRDVSLPILISSSRPSTSINSYRFETYHHPYRSNTNSQTCEQIPTLPNGPLVGLAESSIPNGPLIGRS